MSCEMQWTYTVISSNYMLLIITLYQMYIFNVLHYKKSFKNFSKINCFKYKNSPFGNTISLTKQIYSI